MIRIGALNSIDHWLKTKLVMDVRDSLSEMLIKDLRCCDRFVTLNRSLTQNASYSDIDFAISILKLSP